MVQASRSSIFKNMLESDSYITTDHPPGGTITLAELNYEELHCLLEFLYNGNLSKEKVEKHVYSLSLFQLTSTKYPTYKGFARIKC